MFCYQRSFGLPTEIVTAERFWALVRAPHTSELIDGYRTTGDAALKRKLPAFIFQATFEETVSKKGNKGAWRCQTGSRLNGLVVMDVDHVGELTHPQPLPVSEGSNMMLPPRELFVKWQKEHAELFTSPLQGDKRGSILLIYITPSGHGLKIVFKARTEWGNLIDNQHEMAKLLGVEVDESCKDASRMSFICKESDILYLDDELFTYENKAFGEKYDEVYRAGNSQPTLNSELATAPKLSARACSLSSERTLNSQLKQKPACFLCSWQRRKQLFNLAQKLGCTKIALGHHQDDIIHTALMNLTFQGHFSTMPVKLRMRKMPLTIIRPLCLCHEDDIRTYAEQQHYEKQLALCPHERVTNRTTAQQLFTHMQQLNPEARYNIWSALEAEGKLIEY